MRGLFLLDLCKRMRFAFFRPNDIGEAVRGVYSFPSDQIFLSSILLRKMEVLSVVAVGRKT